MKEEGGEGDKERAERYLSELRYIITVEGTRRAGDNSSVEYVSKSRERKPFSSPRLIVHRVRYITWNFSSSRSIVITRVRICVLRLEIQVEIHATYSVIFKRVVTDIALEYFSSFEDSIFFSFFFKSRKEESPVKNWNHRNDTDGVDANRSVSSIPESREENFIVKTAKLISDRARLRNKFYVTRERPLKKLVHNYRMSRIRLAFRYNAVQFQRIENRRKNRSNVQVRNISFIKG